MQIWSSFPIVNPNSSLALEELLRNPYISHSPRQREELIQVQLRSHLPLILHLPLPLGVTKRFSYAGRMLHWRVSSSSRNPVPLLVLKNGGKSWFVEFNKVIEFICLKEIFTDILFGLWIFVVIMFQTRSSVCCWGCIGFTFICYNRKVESWAISFWYWDTADCWPVYCRYGCFFILMLSLKELFFHLVVFVRVFFFFLKCGRGWKENRLDNLKSDCCLTLRRVVFKCLLSWRLWGGWPWNEWSVKGCDCYGKIMGSWCPSKLNGCCCCFFFFF